ncbi:DNA polymerase III subunit beta [Alicyclobacillus sp. ALC3]|uniref:DNA polymerase III subunit beta n=1 Tax=Alicyclobacillus sp. ALC3 TaxID=2796143 RepID=UPI002378199A|nr:DNA polymerase III subunit beta [Alicyclobacillus sp. ALC3]WDL99725.1 DNA polymerase III subunit beta [Alicyclobacillus sp. ALC3]
MKTTFQHIELEKVLRNMVRVVPSSTTRPVLKHILISADKDDYKVDFYASAEDMSTRRTMYQEVVNAAVVIEESGSCLLPAKELYDIVKTASSEIAIHANGKQVTVVFGKAKFTLSGLDPEQFVPYTDDASETTTAVVLAPDLHRLLRRTKYAVFKGQARPILTGVNLSLSDSALDAVATDALRLAKYAVPCQSVNGDPRSLPIPAEMLDKLMSTLPAHDDDEEVQLTIGSASCVATWGDGMYQMVMRGLDGEYPNVTRIIPQHTRDTVIVNRQAWLDTCERVSIMSQTENQSAEMRFSSQVVKVTAISAQYGKAVDTVDVVSCTFAESDELPLRCNINYLIAMLKSYEGVEQMEIRLVGENLPFVVTPVGEDTGLSLMAPLMRTSPTQEQVAS